MIHLRAPASSLAEKAIRMRGQFPHGLGRYLLARFQAANSRERIGAKNVRLVQGRAQRIESHDAQYGVEAFRAVRAHRGRAP